MGIISERYKQIKEHQLTHKYELSFNHKFYEKTVRFNSPVYDNVHNRASKKYE